MFADSLAQANDGLCLNELIAVPGVEKPFPVLDTKEHDRPFLKRIWLGQFGWPDAIQFFSTAIVAAQFCQPFQGA